MTRAENDREKIGKSKEQDIGRQETIGSTNVSSVLRTPAERT